MSHNQQLSSDTLCHLSEIFAEIIRRGETIDTITEQRVTTLVKDQSDLKDEIYIQCQVIMAAIGIIGGLDPAISNAFARASVFDEICSFDVYSSVSPPKDFSYLPDAATLASEISKQAQFIVDAAHKAQLLAEHDSVLSPQRIAITVKDICLALNGITNREPALSAAIAHPNYQPVSCLSPAPSWT